MYNNRHILGSSYIMEMFCDFKSFKSSWYFEAKKNNRLVVLHNFFSFFFLSRCWRVCFLCLFCCSFVCLFVCLFVFWDFFFKSKSTLQKIIASLSPNEGANKSTSPIKSLHTSFKPVLKWKKKSWQQQLHFF